MRIIVVELNGSGGMAHYIYQLCTSLSDQGAKVTLLTAKEYELLKYPQNFQLENRLRLWPQHGSSTWEKLSKNSIIKFTQKVLWNLRRAFRAFQLIIAWVELSNYIIKEKPDLVQFGKIDFPFEAFFLKRLKKRGILLTQICHEFERRESSGFLSGFFDKSYKFVYQNFSVLFFHAKENLNRFHSLFSYPKEDSYLIPLGNQNIFLEQDFQKPSTSRLKEKYVIESNETVVLFFGILAPSKGVPILIEAFNKLKKEQNIKLIIAGYPSKHIQLDDLFSLVEKHELNERIKFDLRYFPNEEIPELMQLADMVVFPYLNSTQSASVQVAYTFGRPVIASNVGGLPEVVIDGKSGFLVEPGDTEDLAEKIVMLSKNPKLRKKMGENAKKMSESQFSWASIAKKILTVYKGLIEY